MKDYSIAYWEDFYGQDTSSFSKLSYVSRDGKRVFANIEVDIDAQIAELQRTVGSNVEIRLYMEP